MLRGISMNGHMGTTVGGVWVDTLANFRNFGNLSTITRPVHYFVMCDEDDTTINDAWFRVDGPPRGDVAVMKVNDWPATYHGGATGFSYADGHGEIHKWRKLGKLIPGHTVNGGTTIGTLYPVDAQWLFQHTSDPL